MDDPPWDIFGIPRLLINEENIDRFLKMVDDPYNCLTLCSGSLGANPENNVAKSFVSTATESHSLTSETLKTSLMVTSPKHHIVIATATQVSLKLSEHTTTVDSKDISVLTMVDTFGQKARETFAQAMAYTTEPLVLCICMVSGIHLIVLKVLNKMVL